MGQRSNPRGQEDGDQSTSEGRSVCIIAPCHQITAQRVRAEQQQQRRGGWRGNNTVHREMEIITVEREEGGGGGTAALKASQGAQSQLQTAAGTPPPTVGLIHCDRDVLACLWGKTTTVPSSSSSSSS